MVVDGGDFAWKRASIPQTRKAQQRAKAALQLRSFGLGAMDALVPGDGDLALGVQWLQRAAKDAGVPLVASNLMCEGSPPFDAAVSVERDDLSVVIVGVLGAENQVPAGCTLADPTRSVSDAIDAAPKADLVVLLAHQDPEQDRRISEGDSRVDVIVNGGSGASLPEPRVLPNGALQLAAGSRGKKLGVAKMTLRAGAAGFEVEGGRAAIAGQLDRNRTRLTTAERQVKVAEDSEARARAERRVEYFTAEIRRLESELEQMLAAHTTPRNLLVNDLISLTDVFEDDPQVRAMLEAAKDDISAAVDLPTATTKPVVDWVGSQACRSCHPAIYAQWAETPHAHAWKTLQAENKERDLDCWTCHSTGAMMPGGPAHPAQVSDKLASVGCEECHGPGRLHIGNPPAHDMIRSPSVDGCLRCHDGVRDEGRFDAAVYLPRVRHGGQ